MDTNPLAVTLIQIRRRQERFMAGQLSIIERVIDGEVKDTFFTFDSLTSVLDLPKSTLEGRYARARLSKWKQELQNGYGRPARVFPLHMRDAVINLLLTPGAKVRTAADEDSVEMPHHLETKRGMAPLNSVMYEGARHFTIKALAEHFNYSETTIRKKLERANLLGRMTDLTSSRHGGRPRRGFHEKDLRYVFLAVQNDVNFGQGAEAVASRGGVVTSAILKAAHDTSFANLAPHTELPKGSLRAWDEARQAPVSALNSVNSTEPDATTIDIMAALSGLLVDPPAQTTSPQPVIASVPAQPGIVEHRAEHRAEDRPSPLDEFMQHATVTLADTAMDVGPDDWADLKTQLIEWHDQQPEQADALVSQVQRARERNVGGAA